MFIISNQQYYVQGRSQGFGSGGGHLLGSASVGLHPRTQENFRKFANIFERSAKMHILVYFTKNFQAPSLEIASFF